MLTTQQYHKAAEISASGNASAPAVRTARHYASLAYLWSRTDKSDTTIGDPAEYARRFAEAAVHAVGADAVLDELRA